MFHDWFTFSGNMNRYETFRSVNDHLKIPIFWTQKYGCFSIKASNELYIKSLTKKLITSKVKHIS